MMMNLYNIAYMIVIAESLFTHKTKNRKNYFTMFYTLLKVMMTHSDYSYVEVLELYCDYCPL